MQQRDKIQGDVACLAQKKTHIWHKWHLNKSLEILKVAADTIKLLQLGITVYKALPMSGESISR